MKDFKAYFTISAEPEMVYKALTTETTLRLWTGDEAVMVAEPGTEFSLWSGDISGRNLRFEQDKLIEQEWYFGETDTPSIVTIKLHEHKQGTSMEVRQTNIPDEAFEELVDGWKETYAAYLIDFYREG